jgi:CheY-like chemotaxis protein
MMSAVLRHAGHTVVEAGSAREALRLHGEAPADLIITDLVMKDMDGIELLRRVRGVTPHIPVIAVSGNPKGTIWLNMAKLVGAERIIAKPFAPEQLTKAVADVLSGSWYRRQPNDSASEAS